MSADPAALARQDDLFAPAFRVLQEGISRRVFPCASVAITAKGKLVGLRAFGQFTYAPDTPAATVGTPFDLASLTKVVATTSALMILYERSQIRLDDRVVEFVPEFGSALPDSRRAEVTVHHLLAHTSGLPAYVKVFEFAHGREEVVHAACSQPLEAAPGTRAEYSDIGFILLGEIVSRVAGEELHAFCEREIFEPLAMSQTRFCPPSEMRDSIPPTEIDEAFRHRIVQGEVHDENAWAMSGVAGHAGLFATALDIARFAECMLGGGNPILRRETVERFTRRESNPLGTSRALGWDTPSQPSQSGSYLSPQSFGHLGFTGTSLWIDPVRDLSITLLTNRTWPNRESQDAIKQLRPRFHDAVVEALIQADNQ